MAHIKVLIAGSGLGGLCLAQGLRRSGIDVEVFERDSSPWDRPQGCRLHIDTDGIGALHQVLTDALYSQLDAAAMKPLPFTTVVDTALTVQRRIPSDAHGGTEAHELPAHVNVNRATLRAVLLSGLDDTVRYSKKLVHYISDAKGVTVTFEDGTTAHGDVLVGADGIRSSVRIERAPQASTQDSGVRAIYGRIPIEAARRVVPQQAREDVFTVAIDDRKLFLGLGPVVLGAAEDYVVCIVGGPQAILGDARHATSAELRDLCAARLGEWPEHARAIPANGDPSSFFWVEMFTSVPCELAPHANVTLLGDAIHAMTPTLGRGANIAMRDGAELSAHLKRVANDESTIAEALSNYENAMTAYGFDAVRKSAMMGTRLMGQKPLPA